MQFYKKTIEKAKSVPEWESLALVGKNQFVKRTYLFLFLTPLLISSLQKSGFGFVVQSIPFSWHALYFSALTFTIGSFLFELKCPKIIKDQKTFQDFLVNHKSWSHLFDYFENLGVKLDDDPQIEKIGQKQYDATMLYKLIYNRSNFALSISTWQEGYREKASEIEINQLAQSYYSVIRFFNNLDLIYRRLVYIFFVLGFILIGIVFINSFIIVLKTNISLFQTMN